MNIFEGISFLALLFMGALAFAYSIPRFGFPVALLAGVAVPAAAALATYGLIRVLSFLRK